MLKPQRKDVSAWIEWGQRFLRDKPVVPVKEFEAELLAKFKADVEKLGGALLRGKRRTQAENLTDHVKAQLTKRGLIRYYSNLEGVRYIVYLRPIGVIDGHGKIVGYQQAVDLIGSLLGKGSYFG